MTAVRRILVVDDSAPIRVIVKAAIEIHAPKGSVQVIEASGAHAARAELTPGREVHLIVCDVTMPGTSGIDFVHALRLEGHGMPILMLSAIDLDKTKHEALAAGATEYMTKPFEMGALWARIAALLLAA